MHAVDCHVAEVGNRKMIATFPTGEGWCQLCQTMMEGLGEPTGAFHAHTATYLTRAMMRQTCCFAKLRAAGGGYVTLVEDRRDTKEIQKHRTRTNKRNSRLNSPSLASNSCNHCPCRSQSRPCRASSRRVGSAEGVMIRVSVCHGWSIMCIWYGGESKDESKD